MLTLLLLLLCVSGGSESTPMVSYLKQMNVLSRITNTAVVPTSASTSTIGNGASDGGASGAGSMVSSDTIGIDSEVAADNIIGLLDAVKSIDHYQIEMRKMHYETLFKVCRLFFLLFYCLNVVVVLRFCDPCFYSLHQSS